MNDAGGQRLAAAHARMVTAPLAIIAMGALLTAAAQAASAPQPFGDLTISIDGTFPMRAGSPDAKAGGAAPTHALRIQIELTGQSLVYTSEDGRFQTKVDGTPASSSVPARCNGELTGTQRKSSTMAWYAGGMLNLVHSSEAKFAGKGPCGGTTESLNETLSMKLDNGTCSFGYTGVTRRNCANPVSVAILPPQPCTATRPGGKPNVAQVPAAPALSNTACMQQLAASGKRIFFDVDLTPSEVSVVGGSTAPLKPLWSQMEACLNSVYAKKRSGSGRGQGPYNYRQWYNEAAGRFDWCVTQVPEVGVLNEDARPLEYAIWVRCASGAALPNGMF